LSSKTDGQQKKGHQRGTGQLIDGNSFLVKKNKGRKFGEGKYNYSSKIKYWGAVYSGPDNQKPQKTAERSSPFP